MIADRDALPQLLELRARQHVVQVRLPDEHDLNQLRLLGLEIREHAHFLERREAQVLRFVDDEQRQPARRALPDEKLRQVAQQMRLALARLRLEPEVEHHGLDELARIERRVHQARDRRPLVEPPHRRLQQRRLARSDLARDDDESGVPFDTVAQIVQRLGVDAARIEVVGIGAERERSLAEVVEALIHGTPSVIEGSTSVHARQ